MKINFYLKDKNSQTDTYILCSVVVDGKRSRKSTSLRIAPQNWDTKKQRAKSKPDIPHQQINEFLNDVERDALKIHTQYFNTGQPLTPNRLFEELWNAESEDHDLLSFAEQWVESKKTVRESTKAFYRDAIRSMELFSQQENETIDLQLINNGWYERYHAFLTRRGNKPSTRKHYRQTFRSIFEQARKNGLHSNQISIKINDKTPPPFKVALTNDEVTALYEMSLPNERFERIRDLFVVGCRTGLRFSDWHSAKLLGNNKFIIVNTKKTTKPVKIPLHPEARAILTKYDDNIERGKYITDLKRLQDLMKYSKDIIPSLARVVEVPDGNTLTRKQRWELVKTHTARRTFASYLYSHRESIGITDVDIMNITGHTSKDAFYRYIVVNEDSVQQAVFDFFNQ